MRTLKKVLRPGGALVGILLVIVGYILNGQQIASWGLPVWVWQVIGAIVFGLFVRLIVLGLQKRIETDYTKMPNIGRLYDGKMPSHEYISEPYIRGRMIYLMDLLAPGARPIIENRTLEDCEIKGPAMMGLLGGVTIDGGSFDGTLESLFVEVAEKRFIIGAIGLQNVVLRRCRFTQIGIIGTKEQIEKAKQGFRAA